MVAEILSPAQVAYREYLKSEHWRGLRLEAFRKYGRVCAKCGAKGCLLDVHHTRYRRPWEAGVVDDLQILCRPCHENEHVPVVRLVTVKVKKQAQKINPLDKLIQLRAKVRSKQQLSNQQRHFLHAKLMRGNHEERRLANEIFQTNSHIPRKRNGKWKSHPPGLEKLLRHQRIKRQKMIQKYASAMRVRY